MSTRGFDSPATTEIDSAFLRPIIFAFLDFSGAPTYLHNWVGPKTWGGHAWSGVGDFGGIDVIEEGEKVSAYTVTLILSGLNHAMVVSCMNTNMVGTKVKLYQGFLSPSLALVSDPLQMWGGKMDKAEITLGQSPQIKVMCESDLAQLDRANGKLYTDTELKRNYSGDTFFDFLPAIQELGLRWAETSKGYVGKVLHP